MGAPIANCNATRHGLSTGNLPKGCGYIKRTTNQLRNAVEDAVVEAHGEITLEDAAVIQTAIRWERHALLAQRWLRRETASLTPDQYLAFSRDIARASSERDKCIKLLGLGRRQAADMWPTVEASSTAAITNTAPQNSRECASEGILTENSPACAETPHDVTLYDVDGAERDTTNDEEGIVTDDEPNVPSTPLHAHDPEVNK